MPMADTTQHRCQRRDRKSSSAASRTGSSGAVGSEAGAVVYRLALSVSAVSGFVPV